MGRLHKSTGPLVRGRASPTAQGARWRSSGCLADVPVMALRNGRNIGESADRPDRSRVTRPAKTLYPPATCAGCTAVRPGALCAGQPLATSAGVRRDTSPSGRRCCTGCCIATIAAASHRGCDPRASTGPQRIRRPGDRVGRVAPVADQPSAAMPASTAPLLRRCATTRPPGQHAQGGSVTATTSTCTSSMPTVIVRVSRLGQPVTPSSATSVNASSRMLRPCRASCTVVVSGGTTWMRLALAIGSRPRRVQALRMAGIAGPPAP
jgi:hypothetical protein